MPLKLCVMRNIKNNQNRKNGDSFFVFNWDIYDFENLLQSCDRDGVKAFIIKYMPKEGKILDAGCVLGRYVA